VSAQESPAAKPGINGFFSRIFAFADKNPIVKVLVLLWLAGQALYTPWHTAKTERRDEERRLLEGRGAPGTHGGTQGPHWHAVMGLQSPQ